MIRFPHPTKSTPKRIAREKRTVGAMVHIYCSAHHESRPGTLCTECAKLFDYATERLDLCRYGEDKPACNRCPVHCYAPEPRQKVREVMRFAGPRMTLRHPILAIGHLRDLLRSPNKASVAPTINSPPPTQNINPDRASSMPSHPKTGPTAAPKSVAVAKRE